MRLSKLFSTTRREDPENELSKNARLLEKASFVSKDMAGTYSFLPLGLKVLEKISGIIRAEMQELGAQEILMSSLQNPQTWEKSGRWSDKTMDIWFKTKLKNGQELGLAPTHEEPITKLMQSFIHSYRDLPVGVFQFQNKFRNELRAKSGLLRGREFLMKDLYSFSATPEQHDEYYESVKQAYSRIFTKLGIAEKTFLTLASGGSFSSFSHEFQVVCETGEDTIFVDEDKRLAVNQEIMEPEILKKLGLSNDRLKEFRAIEVGNIFSLGTKYSEALNLTFLDKTGKKKPVIMGSYGLGPTRIMGTVVELFADDKGLVWPESIAPASFHLVQIGQNEKVKDLAEELYKQFKSLNVEILFDDRSQSAGVKFADADLIGIPTRIIVSPKTLEKDCLEILLRKSGKNGYIPISSVMEGTISAALAAINSTEGKTL